MLNLCTFTCSFLLYVHNKLICTFVFPLNAVNFDVLHNKSDFLNKIIQLRIKVKKHRFNILCILTKNCHYAKIYTDFSGGIA